MNYLKISNQGLMDKRALTLLGASTKRGDNTKIGMFGSGNKYALAYLLRNKHEVLLYSGNDEIKLGVEQVTAFRDKSFDVITVDGVQTSITTDFGKDWKLWQAIREIYCNAKDEGGARLEYVQSPSPADGETHFYIKNRAEITSFISDFDSYFAENKKVLFENKFGRILEKSENKKLTLYRKGIRCMETDKLSIYDYDLFDVTIDENRLIKYSWEIPSQIWTLIYSCTNKEIIRNVLFNCDQLTHIECISGDFASTSIDNMSDEYKEVIQSLKMAPSGLAGLLSIDEVGQTTVLPNHIFEQAKTFVTNDNLANRFKVYKDSFYVEIESTPLMEITMKQAADFFNECNYKGPLEYPVIFVRFENKEIMGFADSENKRIVLSEVCVEKGVQYTIETMIEEYVHLKYGAADNTRSFQNAIIQEFVKMLKINNAYSL